MSDVLTADQDGADQAESLTIELEGLKMHVGLCVSGGTPNYDYIKSQRREWHDVQVDPETGIVELPSTSSYSAMKNQKEADRNPELVRAFRVSIGIPVQTGRLILVTQRDKDNNYQRLNYQPSDKGLRIYEAPEVSVMYKNRSVEQMSFEESGPLVVSTASKAQAEKWGSNRVDIWTIDQDGMVRTYQLVIQTYDDGKTWRLTWALHGEWSVWRLKLFSTYQPTAHPEIFRNPDVAETVRGIIFEPSAGFPGFDQKAQILLQPAFRDHLKRGLKSFPLWRGRERNIDLKFVEMVKFINPRQGVVKFWDATRFGGYGIIERLNDDGHVTSYQFRFKSFDLEGVELDKLGIPDITRGDYVTWTDELDMNAQEGKNTKQHPPLVRGVQVVHSTSI